MRRAAIRRDNKTPAYVLYVACRASCGQKGADNINRANLNFMCRCARCGRETYGISEVIFRAGYGSAHDLEEHTVMLCGACFDEALNAVYERVPVSAVEVQEQNLKG